MEASKIKSGSWYDSLPGCLLARAEKHILNRWLKKHAAGRLLQVGGAVDFDWVTTDKLSVSRVVDGDLKDCHGADCIKGDYSQLPVESESMDIVLLPHVLAYADRSLPILQEACRVLKPNGKLIVLGLNQKGMWRLCQLLGAQKTFFEKQRFLSGSWLKSKLRRLGLRIVRYQTVCYRPPFKTRKWAQIFLFLEMLGQFCLPAFGAGFMLVALKEVRGTTAIPVLQPEKKLKWQAEPVRQITRNTL